MYAVPICLCSGEVVDQHHLHIEAGSEASVVMANTQTRQRTKVAALQGPNRDKHLSHYLYYSFSIKAYALILIEKLEEFVSVPIMCLLG